MLQVVVTADDFGYSADTVDATVECIDQGCVTSVSLMPNMPATDRALAAVSNRTDVSVGVHLTFAGTGLERPLSPPSEIGALVGRGGTFRSSNVMRLAALARQIAVADIERELIAQIELVRDAVGLVSHVDSHYHLHKLPPFATALSRVLPRYGIRRVRGVQDVYLRRPLLSPTYWLGSALRVQLRGFVSTDHLYMPATAGDTSWDRIGEGLCGSLEIGVHPGRAEPWRNSERRGVLAFGRTRLRGYSLVRWTDIG